MYRFSVLVIILDGSTEIGVQTLGGGAIFDLLLTVEIWNLFKKDLLFFTRAQRVLCYHLISKFNVINAKGNTVYRSNIIPPIFTIV